MACQGFQFTKSLHQAGAWPSLYSGEMVRARTSIMQVYSSIFRGDCEGAKSPAHAFTASRGSFVAPAIMILNMRLCLFVRVCVWGAHELCVALARA
eukprot:8304670-Pyramimonas_sp.AAC.1